MAPRFVHLRLHSAYSLLEGAVRMKEIAGLCEEHGMPAIALTDTSNLFGALEFSETLAKAGVQPIVGTTLPIVWQATETGPSKSVARTEPTGTLVLLAKSEEGYANLLKLSSRAFLGTDPGDPPHVRLADLEGWSEGLICLTGGPDGLVNRLITVGDEIGAEAALEALASLYGDRLYVELQRHGLAPEIQAETKLVDWAYTKDLPLVATNEVFFPKQEDYEAHDALICIAGSTYVGETERRRLSADHYFKSQEEMAALFADLPEALDNTLEIARRCAFRPKSHKPILPHFAEGGESEGAALRRQAEEGLRLRLEGSEPVVPREEYEKRLAYELDIIERMQFPGYFLIVADFIKWAKARGIPVGPGRGSGAGSVVAWALTITDLDPMRFQLLFERFLNPERVSMPDFDIDFCQDRRDEVIRYVQERYGHDQVAQIITFGKLQARAVLRDVGRVLQLPYGQVDRLCKLVPNNPANPVSLPEAIAGEPRLQEAAANDETVGRMLEIGQRLEGLYRHASTHAAGVVIGDRPLDELVPLYRDPRSDMPVTQFNMKWVEPAGLVKFDFLGLKTLTVLARATDFLRQQGTEVDVGALPLDDEATYKMLARGETTGVFQLESSGMRDLVRKAVPGNIEDIIALVALYRPGPMENIPKYLACKHGREKPEFLHETIEPVVADTYGVIIYQEQVMQIAQVFAGYSLGEADLLRRAMGKKIKAEMEAQRARFVDGAVERGVERSQAEYVFDLVDKFAGYGFNKSHSACYAVIAYQTAWLKANHPVEFLAASMSLDINNTDKLGVFRQEARRLGLAVRPPSVNESGADFTVKDGAILYALGAIKNVGRQAMEGIVAEREANGPFRDVTDFAHRLNPRDVNKRTLENLIRAGALDCLDKDRARLMEAADRIVAVATRAYSERGSSQAGLFGDQTDTLDRLTLPEAAPWLPVERLSNEFDAIGFYLSGHPLDDYQTALRRAHVVTYQELVSGVQSAALLAGTITRRQERKSKKGNRFAFIALSDPSGEFEVVVFSDLLGSAGELLETGRSVVIAVEVERDQDEVKLRAQSVRGVDETVANTAAGLRIYLDDPEPLRSLKLRLKEKGRGKVSVVLLRDEGREVEMTLPGAWQVSPQLRGALRSLPGVVDVEEI